MVSAPAGYPREFVVFVAFEYDRPTTPVILVDVVYETAVVIVSFTATVFPPTTVWAGIKMYSNAPQYTVFEVGLRES